MTLGSHQRTIGASQQHITPRAILDPLGPFDTDPCAASPRPWDCARVNYTEADDGLKKTWTGRVWMNPPFDRRIVGRFIERMAIHERGTLLVHARTETAWFQPIWARASALLFLRGRVTFRKTDGSLQTTTDGKVANSGAPVVLAAFGREDARVLKTCGLAGAFVPLERRAA
ncbi:MAG: N-6-adenine-methyltransferase [Methyloceanibacter sp.]|nr:MAG: N-6-adenine-methyltransferase [Methyloceanibacter sp.]